MASTPPASGQHELMPHTHNHTVQFYGDEAFLLDELSRYIGSSLGAGDAGIVLATPAHLHGLAERLTARGVDLPLAVDQGRYVALNAATTLSTIMRDDRLDATRFADLLGGIIDQAKSAATTRNPRVAVFGELVTLLWEDGAPEAAIRLEELWNDLAQTHTFSLLCAYPISDFKRAGDQSSMEAICAAHTQVIPAESFTSLIDDDQRQRRIALLQHRALALESEIEERKHLEQALRHQNQQLQEALSTRDIFLSVAAHELKTPLTSLRAYVQLLLRDSHRQRQPAPERLASALEAIERETGKLNQLVMRLLDTAQLEAGKLRIEPVETDLVCLLRAVIAHHQQHDDAGHPIVFDGPNRLPAFVDPVRFEQVINNLLSNAMKFSPDRLLITIQLRQDSDDGITVAVIDQGNGVPLDQRERIFERFYQADGMHHRSGMGLGLYISQEIIEMHGGRIRVEESDLPGARFVVSLPPSTTG